MSATTARALGGAALAAGAFAASLALPRLLSEPAFVPPLAESRPPACRELYCPQSAREGRRQLVEAQLQARVPELGAAERTRLAEVILEEAELARLDPVLVLAIIEVESGWDLDAESFRGARGLMQLRPATLRGEAARSGLFGTHADDPALNVRAGVRYYRRLLDTFRSGELALMAYNAGPARIGAHLRSGGVPVRFRAYPRRVRAEEQRLRRMLGPPARPQVAIRGPALAPGVAPR